MTLLREDKTGKPDFVYLNDGHIPRPHCIPRGEHMKAELTVIWEKLVINVINEDNKAVTHMFDKRYVPLEELLAKYDELIESLRAQ